MALHVYDIDYKAKKSNKKSTFHAIRQKRPILASLDLIRRNHSLKPFPINAYFLSSLRNLLEVVSHGERSKDGVVDQCGTEISQNSG